MNQSNDERRKNNQTIIELLQDVYKSMGVIETKIENIEEKVDKLEDYIKDPWIQRGLDFYSRHEGHQEEIVKIFYSEYGAQKEPGWKLFPKILEEHADKIKFRKDTKTAFMQKLIDVVPLKSVVKTFVMSIIVVILLTGLFKVGYLDFMGNKEVKQHQQLLSKKIENLEQLLKTRVIK